MCHVCCFVKVASIVCMLRCQNNVHAFMLHKQRGKILVGGGGGGGGHPPTP